MRIGRELEPACGSRSHVRANTRVLLARQRRAPPRQRAFRASTDMSFGRKRYGTAPAIA